MQKILSSIILTAVIVGNLWLNFPETKILADPNDNIFQYGLIQRTNWVWENYGCPLSFSCIPNLTDHLVSAWAEGYPLPFHYSHIPQITTVSSYHLLIKPVTKLFGINYSLYTYYNLTKYLLISLMPLTIFFAFRLVGFAPIPSSLGTLFAAHYSTDGLYGIDPPSYLWRGWGLTSQLYALIFMPLALAFTYRAVKEITNIKNKISKIKNNKQYKNMSSLSSPATNQESTLPKLSLLSNQWIPTSRRDDMINNRTSKLKSIINKLFSSNTFWSVVFLVLTTAGHLGIGIITLLATAPLLFLDLNKSNLIARAKKLSKIYLLFLISLSYWIIPALLYNNYHIISFWDPIWKFDSYGWYEVVRQFLKGEIFDWLRPPIITFLVIVGFFVLLLNSQLFPFALMFAMMMLLYFGRTTWDGLIDLIPGMKDFHQHRFIVGVHMTSLFLLPAGIQWLLDWFKKVTEWVELFTLKINPDVTSGQNAKLLIRQDFDDELSRIAQSKQLKVQNEKKSFLPARPAGGASTQESRLSNLIFYPFSIIFFSALIFLTVKQTVNYASFNNRWIGEANRAFQYDEKNFKDLLNQLYTLPKARIYAGRPGNWGKQFRLGSTELYMLLSVQNLDVTQFLPETWSMMSENDQNFDERVASDYDLLNSKYIVAPEKKEFPKETTLLNKHGPFELYQVPTSGWFDVITSPMFVRTDKTNFLNLVYLWHKSYTRTWKMHPLISVEKNPTIPADIKREFKMVDEVTYEEGGIQKNIFADFPFYFPESTPSGKIVKEGVKKQAYSGIIEVPPNCTSCFVMFKMSYHPNWKAVVDGQEVEKQAVFPYYLAVAVSPGTHSVEFTYQPSRLKVVLIFLEILLAIGYVLYFFSKRIKLHR